MKKRPHYYYAIAEDTETGKRIQEFMDECDDASEKARQWALAHGAETYYESPNGMAGGICALVFPDTIAKEGWERIEANGGIYWLPEPGSQTEAEMYALPVVSETKLIGILELKRTINAKTGKPLPYTFGDETPVIYKHKGWWYVDMPYQSEATNCIVTDRKNFLHRKKEAQQGAL